MNFKELQYIKPMMNKISVAVDALSASLILLPQVISSQLAFLQTIMELNCAYVFVLTTVYFAICCFYYHIRCWNLCRCLCIRKMR
jgi:hypothetical protein